VTTEIDEQVHPGQAAILQSDARFRIVACGRRWGKTVTSAKAVRDALLQHGDGWLAWWVAPTYQQAEIGLRTFLDEIPEEFVDSVNRSKLRVECVTDAIVEFKSADKPDNLRGEGVDLLVADEAAEIDQYAYENALRPTLTDSAESRMIAISTPKGRGWFFEFFQRGRSEDWPEYEAFRGPTTENPFINQSDVADAERELPERVFRQEYLAEFVDETGGVFEDLDTFLFTGTYTLPDNGVDPDAEWVQPPFATGVDLARHEDYRVAVTLDSGGRVVNFDREQGETWPQIQRVVEDIDDRYPGVVAVDASRDNKLVADLEAAGVNLEPVKFSAQRKRDLIENLIAAVEGEELTAPEIDILRTEMEVFEYDISRAGNLSYDAPEGFHDDTVDALALAVDVRKHAAKTNVATTARAGGGEDYGDSDGDAIREAVDQYRQQYQESGKYGKF
jgi:hypothetical protein